MKARYVRFAWQDMVCDLFPYVSFSFSRDLQSLSFYFVSHSKNMTITSLAQEIVLMSSIKTALWIGLREETTLSAQYAGIPWLVMQK